MDNFPSFGTLINPFGPMNIVSSLSANVSAQIEIQQSISGNTSEQIYVAPTTSTNATTREETNMSCIDLVDVYICDANREIGLISKTINSFEI